VALAASIAAAVLAACSSSSSGAGSAAGPGSVPSVTLAIGSDTALPTLPLQIAVGDHLFAKYGVNVNVQVTGSGSKAVDALLAGDAQLSADFYDHVLQLRALGKQLTSFVELTEMPGYALVVTSAGASGIHSAGDLAGKTVGVSAPGSAGAFFVNYLLAKAGKDPSAAHFVGIGIGPTAVAAVERNTVDAAVIYDPDLSQVLARDPSARILVDARSLGDSMSIFGASSYPSMTIFGAPSWVTSHPQIARSVAEAIAAADRYLHTATAAEIESKLAPAAIGADPAFFQTVLSRTIPYISPAGSLDKSALANVLSVQSTADPAVKAANINLASTYTDQFVPGH
jgi:NitT/TauT family transport system substrate-binding protein